MVGHKTLTLGVRVQLLPPQPEYMAPSSRGQDTWFSAMEPGFKSPWRYQEMRKSYK